MSGLNLMLTSQHLKDHYPEMAAFFCLDTKSKRKAWIKENISVVFRKHFDVSKMTGFELAADQGHLAHLNSLLELQTQFHYIIPDTGNSLKIAAQNGHLPVVQRLLQCSEDQCPDNYPCAIAHRILPIAIKYQHLAIVNLLIRKLHHSRLIDAILFGVEDLIQDAINSHNIDIFKAVFTPRIVSFLTDFEHRAFFSKAYTGKSGTEMLKRDILIAAAKCGQVEIWEIVAKQYAQHIDLNLLVSAAKNGSLEAVKTILPRLTGNHNETFAHMGITDILSIFARGSAPLINYLLQQSAIQIKIGQANEEEQTAFLNHTAACSKDAFEHLSRLFPVPQLATSLNLVQVAIKNKPFDLADDLLKNPGVIDNLHSHKDNLDIIIHATITAGNVAWFRKTTVIFENIVFDYEHIYCAAANNQVEMLEYVIGISVNPESEVIKALEKISKFFSKPEHRENKYDFALRPLLAIPGVIEHVENHRLWVNLREALSGPMALLDFSIFFPYMEYIATSKWIIDKIACLMSLGNAVSDQDALSGCHIINYLIKKTNVANTEINRLLSIPKVRALLTRPLHKEGTHNELFNTA